MGTRKKRDAHHRKTVDEPIKARTPKADALTYEELMALLGRRIPAHCGDEFFESLDTYKKDVHCYASPDDGDPRLWRGDLLALSTALERCGVARLSDDTVAGKHREARVVPAWLLNAVSAFVWDGLSGHWPKGRGRQSTASQRQLDAMWDLIRALRFLKLRRDDVGWGEALQRVAEDLSSSPKSIEETCARVTKNVRDDPTYYQRMSLPRAIVLSAAARKPTRGS